MEGGGEQQVSDDGHLAVGGRSASIVLNRALHTESTCLGWRVSLS